MRYAPVRSVFHKGPSVEKRLARRRAVGLRAGMRDRGAPRVDVDVIDLSTTGFRTETSLSL